MISHIQILQDRFLSIANKHKRQEEFEKVKEEYVATIAEEKQEELLPIINRYFNDTEYEAVRNCVLETRKRLDGRGLTRSGDLERSGLPPCAHGSAIFTRVKPRRW